MLERGQGGCQCQARAIVDIGEGIRVWKEIKQTGLIRVSEIRFKGQEFLVNMENRPLMNVAKKNRPMIMDVSVPLISLKNPTDEFTVMLLRKQTAAPKRLPVISMRRNRNIMASPQHHCSILHSISILYYLKRDTITKKYDIGGIHFDYDFSTCISHTELRVFIDARL
jgi:hypothetical protein